MLFGHCHIIYKCAYINITNYIIFLHITISTGDGRYDTSHFLFLFLVQSNLFLRAVYATPLSAELLNIRLFIQRCCSIEQTKYLELANSSLSYRQEITRLMLDHSMLNWIIWMIICALFSLFLGFSWDYRKYIARKDHCWQEIHKFYQQN